MPTPPRSPQALQYHLQLEQRRLRGAELFATGVHQAEVARQFGVIRQAVNGWHERWQAGGPDALRSRGPTGPTPHGCPTTSSPPSSRPC